MELPVGARTLEDKLIIETLMKDEIFIASIEESDGKLRRMYPLWEQDLMIYEFYSGLVIRGKLSKLLKRLRDINYMDEFAN
jgi:hypothetical protein